MNNQRRKAIALLIDQADGLQAAIQEIADEEQEFFENMPESLQQGERGMAAEEAAEQLYSAANSLEDVLDYLRSAEG